MTKRAQEAIEQLEMITAEWKIQLAKINKLQLMEWVRLADSLGVARNDRDHAAKILALRQLRADGKLT